ncbi:hermansky-pudlak syndrome 6 protein [Plakobranchus ocellatus]|uniref:Hermansky-pudlak syndrome 6 protein n=1 Tax=Plakobranchus ocellatus TaxID=259542 RepID=A0AAV4B7G5_9GAST|nr:hermansky-pudlak syndrome 6 protein [Plakobranchus ocellatus]
MDVLVKEAMACLPLFRDELFSDVVCKKKYGNISQVWHFPGHILITTHDGRKLFTFDCIPVALQQAFDQKFLDIPNLSSPLVECFMLSYGILALVDKQGHMRLWKFSENCVWQSWGDLDLCQSNSAEVVSVGYVKSTRQVVWCERRQSPVPSPAPRSASSSISPQYCVCKRQLPGKFETFKVASLGPSSILLHNVPDCNIHAISPYALIISLSYDKNKVSLYMIFNFAQDVMTLYVEDKFVTADFGDGIDFQEIALSCLSSLAKVLLFSRILFISELQ